MAMIPRIYQVMSLDLTDIPIALDQAASHHLQQVLRQRSGDNFVLFNGDGREYHAKIAYFRGKCAYVTIHAVREPEVESPLMIHLVQSLLSQDKMNFVIQKAVELGVQAITPLFTARGRAKLPSARQAGRLSHWQTVAIHAVEQSGRVRIPLINAPCTIAAWLQRHLTAMTQASQARHSHYYLLCSPRAGTRLNQLHQLQEPTISPPATVTLFMGPESGWQEAEVMAMQQTGCQVLDLGARILRAETATIVALTILQYQYGDLTS